MTVSRPLNYGRHLVEDDDIQAVVSVLKGDLITQGPTVERFERAISDYVGAKHAIAVSSATAGLHIACIAAGLEPGKKGITSPLTFVASANAMRYCGAAVKLVDIDAETLNISFKELQLSLEDDPEISVVMPVHFAGLPADMQKIRKISGDRIVIEDASHALGARYECGSPVGCGKYSDMCVFSFHPVKPITTGEGGVVTTNDDDLAHKLRLFRTHGIERDPQYLDPDEAFEGDDRLPWYYEQQHLGFNYRLTDIQAALGLSQLAKLDRFIETRKNIARQYDEAFSALPFIKANQTSEAFRRRSGHHLYTVNIALEKIGLTRLEIVKKLYQFKIGTQIHYIPIYRQPYYKELSPFSVLDFPVTESYYQSCLSIPIFQDLQDQEVRHVIESLKKIISV
ncbi:UDP-4-amino-4,6-dideoxy-N-acetyl-beta-L-altrosamine transaminase [Kiloniella laminariae]|uniref:UDP-4-amino-4, 6-dideoxy-N-acetyl-beta-L-altrosamine transaminase n=1 Tax=Kiloniella laminariae TaxID=454162 RepID=UPI000367E6F6|nr:UDP-4-amino-4,6-dideoxy-N-acetyl-beta-L-altrosamine transaminase [Kiloniella laminariae]